MNTVSWRIEQLQTRLRMQASQGRFWLQKACGLWLVCACLALLCGLSSQERKTHLGIWLWSSLVPLKSVVWRGERYNARELAMWLSRTVYDGTPGEWMTWAVLIGVLPVCVVGLVGWWYVRKPESDGQYIRGAELLPRDVLQARLRRSGGKAGLQLATVTLPREVDRSHFLICGATGSGKSVTIRHLLRQIATSDEPGIVVDPEGELTQEFYEPARGDVLLNPLDARFPGWNPWSECESEADMEAQAASLFPLTPTMNETSTYYHRCARVIYRALLASAPIRDPQQLPPLLANPDALLECLEGTDAAALLGSRASDSRHGMLSTLQIACACFRYLPPSPQPWSARAWATTRRGWCFLTFREMDKEAVLPLVSLWLDSLSQHLLNSALHPPQTTWVVIDELAVLKAQRNLEQLLNRGRKRGIAVVLGFQNVLQLYAVYGQAMVSSMLDMPATRLLLRTNNGETQRWCAEDIGKREVVRAVESETVGPENMRDAISRSHQRREEATVMGSEFGVLPNLQGYLKVAHYGATQVRIPYMELVTRQPAFVGRVPSVETPTIRAERRVLSRQRRLL